MSTKTTIEKKVLFYFFKLGFPILFLCCLFIGCNLFSPKSDAPSNPTSSDNEDLQLLQNLGILDLDTDEDRSENVDNPFGSTTTNLNKTDEIFVVTGDNDTIELYNYSGDNKQSALGTFNASAFSSTDDLLKRPVTADTDGNGKEEVITAVFSLEADAISFYRITDGDSQKSEFIGSIPWSRAQDYYSTDISDLYRTYDNLNNNFRLSHNIDIATGDIDGDEKDEILIASERTLYIVDEDFQSAKTKIFTTPDGSSSVDQLLRVECGDLNQNGSEEIVVANGSYDDAVVAEYSIFTSDSSGNLDMVVNADQITSDGYSLRSAEIAVADVTGDGIEDIVFGGIVKDDNRTNCTLVAQVEMNGDSYYSRFLPTSHLDTLKSHVQRKGDVFDGDEIVRRARDASIPILAVGDLDFDGTDEIVSGDDVLAVHGGELGIFSDNSADLLRDGVGEVYIPGYYDWNWWYKAADTAYLSQVQVGDLTGDGYAEIVVMDFSRAYFRIYRYNLNNLDMEYIDDSEHFDEYDFDEFETMGDSAYFCLPDIDEDSLVLEYISHSLEYSDPYIITVLAAPPYWDLIDDNGKPIQNYEGNGTSFWIETGVSAGTSLSLSMSHGVSIGAKAEIPLLSNGEVEVKQSITTTMSTTFDTSCEMSMECALTSDPVADYVIFSACPIDVYLYQVTQAEEDNEDGLEEGDYVYMTFPRAVRSCMTTVDFYNENNGSHQDIDDTVLSHTVGSPNTYPNQDWVNENIIRANSLSYILENNIKGIVPHLGASNTISYANSVSGEVSFGCEIEISQSKEVSFIIVGGTEQSLSIAISASIGGTIGSGISGTVGGLEDPYYGDPDYMYNWGIYSYFHESADSILPYTVINYWTD